MTLKPSLCLSSPEKLSIVDVVYQTLWSMFHQKFKGIIDSTYIFVLDQRFIMTDEGIFKMALESMRNSLKGKYGDIRFIQASPKICCFIENLSAEYEYTPPRP